ncbi:hypothetical protein FQA39_LY01582 [Lamprigera yunnana]|nr:hypothetical protein FQA39_LY01582 [Lamprigera yunnana]
MLRREEIGGTAILIRELETEDLREYRSFMRLGLHRLDSLLTDKSLKRSFHVKWTRSSHSTISISDEILRRGPVRKTGLKCSVICTCCHGDACENSVDSFAGSEEEHDDDENGDLNVAKLLAQEVEEDNVDENLDEGGRNLQVYIDIRNILSSRRPAKNRNPCFVPCGNCKGYFSKKTLRRHFNKCVVNDAQLNENCMVASRRIVGVVHHKACFILKDQIIPVLRDDEVTKSIRLDELIVLFGNKMCQKYRSPHHHNMIRSRLRLLGRLLTVVRNYDPNISCLSQLIHPKMYDCVINAVNVVAHLDANTLQYKTPTIATNLGTLLKSCCRILISESIKNATQNRQKEAEDFLKLIEEDYGTSINNAARENLAELKRQKPVSIPTTNDIKILLDYLREKRIMLYKKLRARFDFNVWKECSSVTLTAIQVFNRRRAGELERLKIADLNNYQSINDKTYEEILTDIPVNDQTNANKYVRCVLRGKLGRNVSIIIDIDELQTLKTIIDMREKAGVTETNPYVFGLPGSAGTHKYLEACRLLQKYSEECGAVNPGSLRGTQLRKHMATHSATFNLNDSEFMDLTNFMGHADKIHKDHYRLPIAAREITRMSKVLERAQGINVADKTSTNETAVSEANDFAIKELQTPDGTVINSEEGQDPQTSGAGTSKTSERNLFGNTNVSKAERISTKNLQTNTGETSNIVKKKRSVSPMGHVKRRSWSNQERTIVLEEFKQEFESKQLPSTSQCSALRKKFPILLSRSSPQIKSWFDNMLRKQSTMTKEREESKSKIKRNRWQSPEKVVMFKRFKCHLQSLTLPTRIECADIKENEPVLKDRSIEVIKAWVNNEINRKKKTIK